MSASVAVPDDTPEPVEYRVMRATKLQSFAPPELADSILVCPLGTHAVALGTSLSAPTPRITSVESLSGVVAGKTGVALVVE